MRPQLQLEQGTGDTWVAAFTDENGNPIAYTGTEALDGHVKVGYGYPAAATLTPTWNTASAGTVNVPFTATMTAAISPAIYYVEVGVTVSGVRNLGATTTLEILWQPGVAVAPKVYSQFVDLTDLVPWIGDLQTSKDTAGFLRQRGQAAAWTDFVINRHYRGGGGLSRDNYFLPWPQYIPGNPNRIASIYRSGADATQLQGWLDAMGLRLTNQVVEANASYALAKIFDRQIARGGANEYKALARQFFGRAENSICTLDAEIDTVNSPWQTTTQVVKLTQVDTLEG